MVNDGTHPPYVLRAQHECRLYNPANILPFTADHSKHLETVVTTN